MFTLGYTYKFFQIHIDILVFLNVALSEVLEMENSVFWI